MRAERRVRATDTYTVEWIFIWQITQFCTSWDRAPRVMVISRMGRFPPTLPAKNPC
jgi:hypothetical protein